MFKAKVAIMETMHTPVPSATRVPVPVADVDIAPKMSDDVRAQYVALATELGIDQPGLLADAARAYFAARGLRCYDRQKVSAFLTDQFGRERDAAIEEQRQYGVRSFATWGWRPLRKKDAGQEPSGPQFVPMSPSAAASPEDALRQFLMQQQWASSNSNPSKNGAVLNGRYHKPIPLPVLLTVKEVATQFPTARFFVSDEVRADDLRRVDDPFLAVKIEEEWFIIERWDEPAYRE